MSLMKNYMSMLTLCENNMRVLHWKLCQCGFDTAHVRYGDYYEELGKYLDETAEQMISLGENPVNMSTALQVLNDDQELQAVVMDPNMNYSVEVADAATLNIFNELYRIAAQLAADDSLPVDVQDVFMGHAKYFRVEGAYKLNRTVVAKASVDKSGQSETVQVVRPEENPVIAQNHDDTKPAEPNEVPDEIINEEE